MYYSFICNSKIHLVRGTTEINKMVGISFQSKILIMLLIVVQKSQTGQSGVFKKLFGKFSILLFNVDSF